jgi:excisionase family DNA binding protein
MIDNGHVNGSGANLQPLLVTAREAARMLSLSERTVWGLSKAGELPTVRIGRSVRYDPRDLQAWIERSKQRQALPASAAPGPVNLTSERRVG